MLGLPTGWFSAVRSLRTHWSVARSQFDCDLVEMFLRILPVHLASPCCASAWPRSGGCGDVLGSWYNFICSYAAHCTRRSPRQVSSCTTARARNRATSSGDRILTPFGMPYAGLQRNEAPRRQRPMACRQAIACQAEAPSDLAQAPEAAQQQRDRYNAWRGQASSEKRTAQPP